MDQLVELLERSIFSPQKSERWAMYRLVAPVIDFACASTNWLAYFEYNQTSSHGASQSIDIALLCANVPMVMIEAKRVDRNISSGQITKYLTSDSRGIVTNGIDWIFCDNGRTAKVCILSESGTEISKVSMELIVQFIRAGNGSGINWTIGATEVPAWISTNRPQKFTSATRVSSDKTALTSPSDVLSEVLGNARVTKLERTLLTSLLETQAFSGNYLGRFRFEVRESRLSVFDSKIITGSKRICRIGIGKQKPEIVVLAELNTSVAGLDSIAVPFEHDKGSHMKCYRLGSEEQSRDFGMRLGMVLFRE